MESETKELPKNIPRLTAIAARAHKRCWARFNEHIAHLPDGIGLINGSILMTPVRRCGWLDDLILHDAARDIRSSRHALTIARDVLQSCQRIVAKVPDLMLNPTGLLSSQQAEQA